MPVVVAIEHRHGEPKRNTTSAHVMVLTLPVWEVTGTVKRGVDSTLKQVALTVYRFWLSHRAVRRTSTCGTLASVYPERSARLWRLLPSKFLTT
jgi:hypothetical protein